MRISVAAVMALALSTAFAAAQTRTTLDIYVIDVEGGNATLFATPSGESVLIDTGNLNGATRDDGTFTVVNPRNGFSNTYAAR